LTLEIRITENLYQMSILGWIKQQIVARVNVLNISLQSFLYIKYLYNMVVVVLVSSYIKRLKLIIFGF